MARLKKYDVVLRDMRYDRPTGWNSTTQHIFLVAESKQDLMKQIVKEAQKLKRSTGVPVEHVGFDWEIIR